MAKLLPMPEKITIEPHVYAIKRPTAIQMGEDLGGCDTNVLEITVKKRLKKTKAQETLMHEILHACTHPTCIGREHMTDEEFVTAVAPVLLHVIQVNPDVIAYLQQI